MNIAPINNSNQRSQLFGMNFKFAKPEAEDIFESMFHNKFSHVLEKSSSLKQKNGVNPLVTIYRDGDSLILSNKGEYVTVSNIYGQSTVKDDFGSNMSNYFVPTAEALLAKLNARLSDTQYLKGLKQKSN